MITRKLNYLWIVAGVSLLLDWGCTDHILPEDTASEMPPGGERDIYFTATAAVVKDDSVRSRSAVVDNSKEILLDGDVFCINTLVEKRTDNPFAAADGDERMEAPSGVSTRAKRVTKDDLDKFYVTGHEYATTFAASSIWEGMRNVTVPTPASGSALWQPDGNSYYWPGKGTYLRFTAIANCDTAVAKLSADGKSLTYTVPASASDQKDILAAISDELPGNYGQPVQLNFNHLLASIRIRLNSMASAFTITKWEITGIPSAGTYDIANARWAVDAATANYATQTLTWTFAASGDSTIIGGAGDANTFNVIPQTLPEGAKLKLTYKVSGDNTEYTNEVSVAGDQWEAGKIFTYYLTKTLTTYHLDVVDPTFTYTGGISDSMKIRSYKHIDDGTAMGYDVPVEWQLQTVASVSGTDTTWEDMTAANMPEDWFVSMTMNDTPGSADYQSYVGQLARQPLTYTPDSYTMALRGRSSVGTKTNPRDLSLYDIGGRDGTELATGRETANCYVVMQPGWYKIPMVYGNAIKGGATNSSAYTSTTTGTTVLQTFVRHDGNDIAGPWIVGDNGITIDTATIVWQDEWEIVTDIHLDGEYIVFHVDPEFIHEGNALIAAKTPEGVTVWSWHIWITANALTAVNMQNYNNLYYSFLPVDIGACNGTEPKYSPARDTTIRIVQKDGGSVVDASKSAPKRVKITQTDFRLANQQLYGCTFYQWGRKDPMLPSDGIGVNMTGYVAGTHTQNKTYYGADGNVNDGSWSAGTLSGDKKGKEAIALYIQNPGVMDVTRQSDIGTGGNLARRGYAMDGAYMNLWHANASASMGTNVSPSGSSNDHIFNNNKIVKTVYDPSPTGYVVPPTNARTGVTRYGGTASTVTNVNCSNFTGSGNLEYYYVYITHNPFRSGETLAHKTNGYRHPGENGEVSNQDGTSTSCGQFCRKWCAVAYDLKTNSDARYHYTAVNLYLAGDSFIPNEIYFSRGFGFTVQPVREDSPIWQ